MDWCCNCNDGLYQSAVVKRELSVKARLSIYQLNYVPTLTYGHMGSDTKEQMLVVEMSFSVWFPLVSNEAAFKFTFCLNESSVWVLYSYHHTACHDRTTQPPNGPSGLRFATEGEILTQLKDVCRSVIYTADNPKILIQVVFFDHFLSFTTLAVSFMDIKGLRQILTDLRARLCFELFGMGSSNKIKSADLLEATWYSRHQLPFPSFLIAKSLDPPLRKKLHPRYLHHTPTLSCGSV